MPSQRVIRYVNKIPTKLLKYNGKMIFKFTNLLEARLLSLFSIKMSIAASIQAKISLKKEIQ
jgi:hypothetical protein